LSPRIAAIPLLAEEPIGEQALLELSSMVGSAS
jgi:hypothetical protein